MAYHGVELQNSITIGKIFSIHYFEYMSNFSFAGNLIISGNLSVQTKEKSVLPVENLILFLKKGDLIFHKPNEFHDVKATGGIAPNLVVISFECNDDAMYFLMTVFYKLTRRNVIFLPTSSQKRRCFDCRLDDPYLPEYAAERSGHLAHSR